MFKVGHPILDLLKLILGVSSDFAPDIVHKNRWLSKTFIQEGLEFVSGRKECAVAFNLAFVLLLAEKYMIFQEGYCKKHVSIAFGSSYFKTVLVLLAKVVALYVQILIV